MQVLAVGDNLSNYCSRIPQHKGRVEERISEDFTMVNSEF